MTNRVAMLILGMWITLQCQAACASTLTKEDQAEFQRLTTEAGQLGLDALTAAKEVPFHTGECLARISNALNVAHGSLIQTVTLITISIRMEAASDEAFVNTMLLASIDDLAQVLRFHRNFIGETNNCEQDKIVNEKTRLAQDLLSEAARSVGSLQNKLKAAQK